jgi:copper chaperone NosL
MSFGIGFKERGYVMVSYKTVGIAVFLLAAILVMSTSLHAQSDIDANRHCFHCGMDRKAYGYSRMLLRFSDGTVVGVCSIHCAAAELDANPARTLKHIEVADRDTRVLIDAENAYWVLGGDKPGVMTSTAKWAFAEKKRAEKFVKEHGGRAVSFNEALGTAIQPE